MKVRSILFVFHLFIFGTAQAGERLFVPVAADGQALEYADGEALVLAKTSRAIVMVSYVPRDKKTAFLKLGIQNISDAPFNFSEASVSASAAGTALLVMSYADRVKEEKRHQALAAVGASLSAAANSINATTAGYSNSYGTYSGTTSANAYGSGGFAKAAAHSYGSYSGATYDSTAAYLAKQSADVQNQALFARQKQNAEFSKLDLQARALKANTLSPDEMVLGDVRLSIPKRHKTSPAEFTATINVEGEQITFLFREQE